MFQREIYKRLVDHLAKKQVTVITGMRRVGKSTAMKYLLEHAGHGNYIYLDCERVELRVLLNQPNYEDIRSALELRGLDFSKPCLIAFDEIQLVPGLPSLIKYFYDTYPIKFLVTGSSSYYMKNTFSESLAGRKRIFEMYPLSFSEFLVFKELWSDNFEIQAWKPFGQAWFDLAKDWYNEYLTYGGFPEVVLEKNISDKKELLLDIINSYIWLDVQILADFTVGEELFKLMKLLAARSGNKIDHTKLSSVSGISRQKLSAYFQLLEQTFFIYQLSPFTKNVDKEISQQRKLYFADTGLLQALSEGQLSSGQVFENAIAAQLKPLGELQYFQKRSGQEIDFILAGDTALEVKETPLEQDKNSLRQRANGLQIDKHFLIGRNPPASGFTDFIWAGSIY
jgi:predicted AAA+ superfamily ATPase